MEKILKELLKKQQLAKVSHDVAWQLEFANISLMSDLNYPIDKWCDEQRNFAALQREYDRLAHAYDDAIGEILRSDAVPADYKKMCKSWGTLYWQRRRLDRGAA